jgi:hypothetical protein
MEFEAAKERVHANTADHLKMVRTLYETPGFPADEITDYYAGTRDDILIPGYEQGVEKLTELSTLAEKMNEATPYIAMVRTKLVLKVSHANAISFPNGYRLDHAWVRVFKDLTPDKIKVVSDSIQMVVGDESGAEMFKNVIIDHPSELFEFGREVSYDESAIFDTTQRSRSYFWNHVSRETDAPARFVYGNSIEELVTSLQSYERNLKQPLSPSFGAFVDDIVTTLLLRELEITP